MIYSCVRWAVMKTLTSISLWSIRNFEKRKKQRNKNGFFLHVVAFSHQTHLKNSQRKNYDTYAHKHRDRELNGRWNKARRAQQLLLYDILMRWHNLGLCVTLHFNVTKDNIKLTTPKKKKNRRHRRHRSRRKKVFCGQKINIFLFHFLPYLFLSSTSRSCLDKSIEWPKYARLAYSHVFDAIVHVSVNSSKKNYL